MVLLLCTGAIPAIHMQQGRPAQPQSPRPRPVQPIAARPSGGQQQQPCPSPSRMQPPEQQPFRPTRILTHADSGLFLFAVTVGITI